MYFKCFTEEAGVATKDFYSVAGIYIGNKTRTRNGNYMLLENSEIIRDELKIAETFNDYFVNIVERTTSKNEGYIKPKTTVDSIETIINDYKDHPSIKLIKSNTKSQFINEKFSIPPVTEKEVEEIINKLNPKKSSGLDKIPIKVVKLTSDVITKPLTDIINATIHNSSFVDKAKIAKVTPIYKSAQLNSRLNTGHHRPISVLSVFSKIFEKHYFNSMEGFVDTFLNKHVSAYRKGHSSEHVLLRLTEEWRQNLDQNKIVGAVLMDLSKAFDCLPHELLIAKLEAYGFDYSSLKLIYSYLKGRKQAVSINGIISTFLDLLSGVPQGSILGPILFNIFMNDLFFAIKEANLHNFADDNTISDVAVSEAELVKSLESESCKAIDWLSQNSMIANPGKFHGIILKKNRTDTSGTKNRH